MKTGRFFPAVAGVVFILGAASCGKSKATGETEEYPEPSMYEIMDDSLDLIPGGEESQVVPQSYGPAGNSSGNVSSIQGSDENRASDEDKSEGSETSGELNENSSDQSKESGVDNHSADKTSKEGHKAGEHVETSGEHPEE